MTSLPDVLDILSEMIRCDSRNLIPLDSGNAPAGVEYEMSRIVEHHLGTLGFTIEEQFVAPQRPNIIAFRSCGVPNAPVLGFNAHLDTVGTDNMEIPPFLPEVRDGKIFGRGSCDTKASLATMLKAAEVIIAEKLPVDLLYVATVAEETGTEGSALLDLSYVRCNGFFIGEPTSNRPVVFHKNHCTVHFATSGRAAHGSRPELGDNAVVKAARLVTWLDEVQRPAIEAIQDPHFERGCTFSVNVIRGGAKCNIIPDSCIVECDARLLPSVSDPHAFFQSIATEATRTLGFPVTIAYEHIAHAMATPLDNPFVQAVRDAVSFCKGDNSPLSVAYGTDGGNLSARGFPCVVLGPGDIAHAHAAIEYCPIAELYQAIEIYTQTARTLVI
ncbi:MAG: M20/M25/M40 family metallo-hydrolase [Victivallales bacterium]|nr:M20/M25/M40 family metallo-hydrolase [Victivallales bacterium]